MVFSSITFLYIFLPLLFLFYVLNKNVLYRKIILTIFSLIFYAWGEPIYILLMLFVVLINYGFSILLLSEKIINKKNILVSSIAIDIIILIFFKYTGMILQTINFFNIVKVPVFYLPLPLGISFYTFQIISYMVDIYKGKVTTKPNFLSFLMYVSFFPQLIAGPIVRYIDIEKDIESRNINYENVLNGAFRFSIGFSKKVIFANSLGEIVNLINNSGNINSTLLSSWIVSLLFILQLYFDFSGYSDMAIGIGKIFNFSFPENFNYPYESTSITEFWRRWNMTVMSFFRDYVYIPLGGKYKNQIRNLIIVWILTGLWHGASYNFLFWGIFNGLIILFEKYYIIKLFEKMPQIISIVISHIYTLFILIIGFTIFQYTDLNVLINTFNNMFYINKCEFYDLTIISIIKDNLILIILSIILSTSLIKRISNFIIKTFENENVYYIFKSILIIFLLILSTSALIGKSFNPFLYFRF